MGGGGWRGQTPHLSLLLLRWPASPAPPRVTSSFRRLSVERRTKRRSAVCVCESLSMCVCGCLRASVRVCLGARQCESVREWAGPRPSGGDSFMTMSEERGPPRPLLLSSSFPSLPFFFPLPAPQHTGRPAARNTGKGAGR